MNKGCLDCDWGRMNDPTGELIEKANHCYCYHPNISAEVDFTAKTDCRYREHLMEDFDKNLDMLLQFIL